MTGRGKYAVAELRESYTFNISGVGCLSEYDVGETITSDPFNICGTDWEIVLTPNLYDSFASETEEENYCAIHLVHLAQKTVRVGYTFKLTNLSGSGPDWIWREEDDGGIVTFEPAGTGNSKWGTEEFIASNVLSDIDSGFILQDRLVIEVVIEIYGDVELSRHPLTKAIESAAETEDLIKLADADLSLIKKALPATRDAQDINKQQDIIVRSRLHHKHVQEMKSENFHK